MFYVTGLALVTGAVIGLATGGGFTNVSRHRLRAWWLVVIGFGLQLVADRVGLHGLGTPAVLGGATALLAFAALNPSVVGIGVVATGVAANALVIGLDNGMPVQAKAIVAAHIAPADQVPFLDYGYRHHAEEKSDLLRTLDDRIPLPVLHQVVSYGDLILAVGVASTVQHLFGPPMRHSRLART